MSETIFDLDEFKGYAARWDARQKIFAEREAYYNGSVYSGMRRGMGWLGPRLGAAIRPLYLPLARSVVIDAGLIPGGWKLQADAAGLASAVRTVLTWSDWRTDGMQYALYGAKLGSVGLKVCDLQAVKRVVVKPVEPSRFMLLPSSVYDSTPALALVVEKRSGDDSKEFEYAEAITPDFVRTFKNGQPHAYAADRAAEYANVLGFVPFVETPFLLGGTVGECTFTSVVPLLDEVNALATDLAETLKQFKDPQYYTTGVESGDLKRGENIWYLPDANGKAGALVAPIDVAGVLSFIQEIAAGMRSGLAELAFDDLRSKQQLATATVQLQLMELTIKIGLVRANFDHGLVTALRLAGRAASVMGLRDVSALDSEALAFDSEREIIPLDPQTRAEIAKVTAEAAAAGSTIEEKSPPMG